MLHSDQFEQVAAALAGASAKFGPISRTKTVKVNSRRTGNSYSFSYAPLESILAAIRPALSEAGIFISQAEVPVDGLVFIETRAIHSSGQWIGNRVPLLVAADNDNGAQAHGSGATYARRYGVSELFCLAADDDDDASMAEGNAVQQVDRPAGYASPERAISEKQANLVASRLAKAKFTPAALCVAMGIEHVSVMPAARMDEALAMIEQRDARLVDAAASAPDAEAAASTQSDAAATARRAEHDKVLDSRWEDMVWIRAHLGIVPVSEEDAAATGIDSDFQPNAGRAMEIWRALSQGEQTALWLAPTKGGWLTGDERLMLRSLSS